MNKSAKKSEQKNVDKMGYSEMEVDGKTGQRSASSRNAERIPVTGEEESCPTLSRKPCMILRRTKLEFHLKV